MGIFSETERRSKTEIYICVAHFRVSTRMTVVPSTLQPLKSNAEEACYSQNTIGGKNGEACSTKIKQLNMGCPQRYN